MIQPEQLVEGEWAEWYRLTPAQRWLESEKLWQSILIPGEGGGRSTSYRLVEA